MLHYQQMHKGSLEAQNHAAEIKLRAERKLGELLKETTVKGGERHKLRDETYERVPTLPSDITKIQSHYQ